jgi:hypothetical protein
MADLIMIGKLASRKMREDYSERNHEKTACHNNSRNVLCTVQRFNLAFPQTSDVAESTLFMKLFIQTVFVTH